MEPISLLYAIIMGIVQGATEFLPISSSGHLVLASHLMGGADLEVSATFEVLLHAGTLIAVFAVYYKDVIGLIREFFLLIRDLIRKLSGKQELQMYDDRKMLLLVLTASVPTLILGVVMKVFLEDLFMSSVAAVGIALMLTAAMLILSVKIPAGKKKVGRLSFRDAAVIGVFQGVATTPGISRSGSTIVGGLMCGLEQEFAVRFSFLISLPAIAGATLLSVFDMTAADIKVNGMAYLIGFIVSAVVGYICIRVLLVLLKKRKFQYFGYYCALAGLVAVICGIVM